MNVVVERDRYNRFKKATIVIDEQKDFTIIIMSLTETLNKYYGFYVEGKRNNFDNVEHWKQLCTEVLEIILEIEKELIYCHPDIVRIAAELNVSMKDKRKS